MSFPHKSMQNAQAENSRASSLQKDRGLGAGPHACGINHQSGDESLHSVS